MASYDEKLSGLIDKPCLYSTICATRVDAETGEAIEPLYDEAGTYCEVIARQMEAFRTKEYPTDDLMRYFCLPNSPQTETSIKSKIRSAHVTVEAVGKNLYGKLKLDMTADLTSRELEAFTRQIEVQYRDGWGAEFELLDICAGKDCVCLRLWHDEISFFTGQEFELEKQRHTLPHCAFVSEVNKDTFWELLAQAKARCGQDLDASALWLEGELLRMGPEQALNFDNIMHGYSSLAYKYGLWTAASVMLDRCNDDGFTYFRNWLIAQGKDVYLAALKDPDSLADVPVYGGGRFEPLDYLGASVYEQLTGKDPYSSFDRAAYEALEQDLARDIQYGEGIGYPYTWSETADYLPKLCGKYLTPEDLATLIQYHNDTWNPTSREVQQARETAPKSKKIRHRGGEAR